MDKTETPPPSAQSVTWNAAWGVGFAIIAYFAASFLAGLLLLVIANPLLSHKNDTLTQFLYVMLFGGISVLGVQLFVKRYKRTLASIGFKRPRLLDAGIGLLVYPVYFIFFAAVLYFITQFVPGIDANQKQQLGFDSVQGTVALTLTFISLVVIPPFVEEIVVRGLIFTSLRKKLNFTLTALLTSTLFAVAHLPEGGSSGPLYIAAVDTFILSMVLCFVRERTGSLWAGITLHALKNGIAYVSLFILATR